MSSPPNKLFPLQRGFPTPDFPPMEIGCRILRIPASEEYYGLVMGALYPLINPWNWYKNGEMEIDEACEFFQDFIDVTYEDALLGQCSAGVPSPFWTNASDNELEAPVNDQPWYGSVTDWLAPVDELDFAQNVALWAITGFVAYAAGPGAAIFFRTTAKRFIVAVEATDIAEIIRVVVDSAEFRVDTTGFEGQIIELDVIADPDLEEHDIYVIQGEFE